MPRPRRVYFADILTPLTLTEYGYATLPDHDLALQQHTDQGMVLRVRADTAEQAAEQVIGLIGEDAVIGSLYDADRVLGAGDPISVVDGAMDPRLVPPELPFGPPSDPPDDNGWAWEWGPQ